MGEESNNKDAFVNAKRKPPAVSQLILAVCSLLFKKVLYDITIH